MENSRKIIGNILIALMLIVVFASSVNALSELGGSCQYSRDCSEGYCSNSTCRFPTILENTETVGICSKTSDCFRGFCKDNQCVIPATEKYDILEFGVKSSCAGFIENCTGFWCAICNVSWILLVVGTALAVFITRKRGRRIMVLLAILPVITGLILFPILGFIVSLIEIGVFALLKRRNPKVKTPEEKINQEKIVIPRIKPIGLDSLTKIEKPKRTKNDKKSKK